ncbi:argininosuccinate lyase [Steroidobacter denitrificans]|uniref:Argininosuccinate lyase n=1 Tax=Steroidobacter denitrificans TaxID=465721 RepID=A0A127FEC7_STEDE|nr:argininosuccinate lyase [Steroidobacter denitrificans]AMN48221.1 argininosuccinate lyase [Steroidobacter denitrificans]
MSRLWDKGAPLDERVLRYTAGEDHALDNRLVAYDVRASIAHAQMLHAQGLLPAADLEAIRSGLTAIAVEHARGEWQVRLEHEDGQTALENLLTQRIGEAGKRVHLGRSRNDQVLTALRLYLRDAADALAAGVDAVAEALENLARRDASIELPGYTHMQQAMPSSVPLWANGFAAELRDDAQGLRQTHRRLRANPLGSAAGYGSPNLPIDREDTREQLGFETVQMPVTAVQLSRGKAEAQLLFEIALVMQDVARLSADLLLFYTQEFSFVALPDAFTTGSSIMPQKRNPDVFELIRGRSATAMACLAEVMGIVAKLPSGYQRDLQLIKAPLFRSIDLCMETLDILPAALAGVRFRPEKIRLDPSIHAAAEANALVVNEGISFREAYRRIGERLKQDAGKTPK